MSKYATGFGHLAPPPPRPPSSFTISTHPPLLLISHQYRLGFPNLISAPSTWVHLNACTEGGNAHSQVQRCCVCSASKRESTKCLFQCRELYNRLGCRSPVLYILLILHAKTIFIYMWKSIRCSLKKIFKYHNIWLSLKGQITPQKLFFFTVVTFCKHFHRGK